MTTTETRLFDVPALPDAPAVEPVEQESYGVRLTRRREAMIAAGRHPATKVPLREPGETCRSCCHAVNVHGGARSYWKCDRVPMTHGPGSDIRLRWPACEKWEYGR